MSDKYTQKVNQILAGIAKCVPPSHPQEVAQFVRQFYAKMPLMDLERLDPPQACQVALSAYRFLQEPRKQGKPHIRIFTPQKKEHGWQSDHLIIELINDDMPFLVDSISAELTRQGFTPYLTVHPILHVSRDARGALKAVHSGKMQEGARESLIHIECSPLPEDKSPAALEADLELILKAVRYAVEDWKPMLAQLAENIDRMRKAPDIFRREDIDEAVSFLEWIGNRNFVFLGYIEYDFYDEKGKESLSIVKDSPLGVLRMEDFEMKPKGLAGLPPQMLHFAFVPHLIEITKSNQKSVIHRPVHMEYIGLKRFDARGKVIGETRFLGMFASAVFYQSAGDIPLIRRKFAQVLARAGFDPLSHDGKALKAILEFAQRDELFQMTEDELFEYSLGVLALEARPIVRLFIRKDLFERFLICTVFVPRERFSTSLREQIQVILERAYGANFSTFYTRVTESPLARVIFTLRTTPGKIPEVDIPAVERQVAQVTHLWSDLLREALVAQSDGAQAERLMRRYSEAFPKDYIASHTVEESVHDIAHIEKVLESGMPSLELIHPVISGNELRLRLFSPDKPIILSHVLPILENLGFSVLNESPYTLSPREKLETRTVWIQDFVLAISGSSAIAFERFKPMVEEALSLVWRGEIENDLFNSLILYTGLSVRQAVMMRAYAKYMKQTGFSAEHQTIAATLGRNAEITQALADLFEARFNPAPIKSLDETKILARIEDLLSKVALASEDRILRRYSELMQATLRTNYYQHSSKKELKPYLSFKFESAKVPELPLPRPHAEIFVYHVRIEGIHLRGGKVARGGLRWSDRGEDFRTEVLGLMKAQMVKNAVIVPVGSKGGFFVKQPPAEREALQQEGIECYRIFLRGLLDLTDNLKKGKVIPVDLKRHDGDDPYLVVAADKGTASFSDIANGVAKEYDFWLDDAFASGGSAGYDHKKMAITARGAWVSVERHFRELGKDIAKENFTAAGIGDMAGDVFGNGMLLSDKMKLLAAFNHMHIFLDPEPDPKRSFAERKRLFKLPRSSWKDYDAALISKGGGVFERSAKSIPLSVEVKKMLGVTKAAMPPDELIRAILTMPVDLLWNGGIGTYVKAEDETHEQVGDRTNNNLRVNGKDLRCKVMGEGGNLGFTQKGRIEYALNGGRINTDAIDNSGGVDCSDHEVNIKIALGASLASGKLSLENRDKLLARMTDDVAFLVLRDNYLQTQAISMTQAQGVAALDAQSRLMQALETSGLLNRAVEYLPVEKQLAERRAAGLGLTRPEIAVLLAYSKMALYGELLASTLPDDPYLRHDLLRYFPEAMAKDFAKDIEAHPLKREIIATVATNSMINRVGMTFFQAMAQETGFRPSDIARAYTVVRDVFNLRDIWAEIEAQDGIITPQLQSELQLEINRFVEHMTRWLLRSLTTPIDMSAAVDKLSSGVTELLKHPALLQSPDMATAIAARKERYQSQHLQEALADKIAALESFTIACDVVMTAGAQKKSVSFVAGVHTALESQMSFGWLRSAAQKLAAESYWDRRAILSIIDDLFDRQHQLALHIIYTAKQKTGEEAVNQWVEAHRMELGRYFRFVEDLKSQRALTVPMLVVAARHVEGLTAS